MLLPRNAKEERKEECIYQILYCTVLYCNDLGEVLSNPKQRGLLFLELQPKVM